MVLVSPEKAFLYAKSGHFPKFPKDYRISTYFFWNEVFVNELSSDGIPTLEIFRKAATAAQTFDKVCEILGVPMTVSCWYRSPKHMQRMIKQGYAPASKSAHNLAMAIDSVPKGVTFAAARTKLVKAVKAGELKVRIEANTKDRLHTDTGNDFTKNYKWGTFNP